MDVPHWATTTMELLRLDKKYRATILQTQINTLGMLDKVKHYVSWQEADLEITKELLDKRGRKSGYRKIESEDLKEMGFAGIDEMASSIAEGKVSMSKIKTLKPWFAPLWVRLSRVPSRFRLLFQVLLWLIPCSVLHL